MWTNYLISLSLSADQMPGSLMGRLSGGMREEREAVESRLRDLGYLE